MIFKLPVVFSILAGLPTETALLLLYIYDHLITEVAFMSLFDITEH